MAVGIVRELRMDMYTLLYLKWITNKDLLTLLNIMWQPGWQGSLEENGYMYMYGWVPFLFTWNYHNIVNQYKIQSFFFFKKHCLNKIFILFQKQSPTTILKTKIKLERYIKCNRKFSVSKLYFYSLFSCINIIKR